MIRKLSKDERRWQTALADGWAFRKQLYLLSWSDAPITQRGLSNAMRHWWLSYATYGMAEDSYWVAYV
jgi:hypothetical protein